jgi:hypothetical protein
MVEISGSRSPRPALLSLVRPHYAKAGNGRRPVGLEIMLRVYFVQQWFNLSDPGVEEALYWGVFTLQARHLLSWLQRWKSQKPSTNGLRKCCQCSVAT